MWLRAARLLSLLLVAMGLCVLSPTRAWPQGCTACRDATAGSAPAVRAGFRKAIPILAIPASALFIAVLVVARRTRDGRSS